MPSRHRPAPPTPHIRQRIETVLGEFRIVVPGLAALFGFQLMAAFQASFVELPAYARIVNLASVTCTLLAFVFLLLPACYHRFTARLEESTDFLRFAQASIGTAFVFLPFALVGAFFVQALQTLHDPRASASVAALLGLVMLVAWWIVPHRRAKRHGMRGPT